MDKVLYISFLNEDIREGYKKKIHSQVSSLSELCAGSILLIMGDEGLHQYEYIDGKQISKRIITFSHQRRSEERNIFDEYFSFIDLKRVAIELQNKYLFKIVYIRRVVPITPMLLSLMKELKTKGTFLVYEYPTYPWKPEMKRFAKTFSRKLFYALDVIFYKQLISIPDMITYLGAYHGKDERFFQIQNCGSSNMFPCVLPKHRVKEINLLAVAHVTYMHGYDLVIEALHEYYKQPREIKVFFHIVGTTDGAPEVLALTKEYKLEEYVIFHGYTTGEKLDELYQMADIGINAVRIDNEDDLQVGKTTLKTVEYTFRGLPQVSGAGFTVDRNKVDVPSFLLVQTNRVSISEIVRFFNNLSIPPEEIRQYAIRHMSWNRVFSDMLIKINLKF